jgi:hypothetical protein
MRKNLGDNFVKEVVINGDVTAAKFVGKDFLPEPCFGLVPSLVARNNLNRSVLGQVIRQCVDGKADLWVGFIDGKSREKVRTRLNS